MAGGRGRGYIRIVRSPAQKIHTKKQISIYTLFWIHAVFLTNLSCSRTWLVFMSSQNEYDSRIQLEKLNKNHYTKLAKFDTPPPPTRYHLPQCAYSISTCSYLDIFMAMYVMDDIQTPFVGLSVDTLLVRSASWCHYLWSLLFQN